MAPLVDEPTWGFLMLWADLHVGFYILIETFLQHGLQDCLDSVLPLVKVRNVECSVCLLDDFVVPALKVVLLVSA
jgi:hypothetical protein